MASDKLTVASSEPVLLPEESPKTAASENATNTTNADASSESNQALKPVAAETSPGAAKQTTTSSPTVPPKNTLSAQDTVPLGDEGAPPPPRRPVSPLSQIKQDLRDAFPQVEEKYITAVLIASGGQAEPAFNGLLSLLDPSIVPVLAPVVPVKQAKPATDDELLARQLQKEFDREERHRRRSQPHAKHAPRQPRSRRAEDDSDDSPDEFEQLKKEFSQGFEEAKTTINGWVSGIAKKFLDNDETNQKGSPKLFGALGGSSFNSSGNRNKRFDEDPEILSSDFSRNVNLNDDAAPKLPKRTEHTEDRWQPLNSDVPVNSDAFLVTDLEDEDKDKK